MSNFSFSVLFHCVWYLLTPSALLQMEEFNSLLCLENPMDGGAWKAAVHGVAEGRTRLSDFTFTFHFHALEKEMATHSSVLGWRISGTGEPGGLPSIGSHRVRHDWSDLAVAVWLSNIHIWKWEVVTQLCLTLCNLIDCNPSVAQLSSPVHGILEARIMQWVVIPFSRKSSWLQD